MNKRIRPAQVLPAALTTIACVVFSAAALGEPASQEVKIEGDKIVTVTVGHERLGLMPVEALQLSRSVRFADLDLTTRAGATALQNRILDTATTICNKLMDVNPPGSAHQALQEKTTCVNDAVDGAMTKARQVISSARAR